MANTTPTHRPLRQDELDAGLEASRLFEAVAFTAAETGFLPRLVEKDYFASVLLAGLASRVDELAFRGGTCLATAATP